MTERCPAANVVVEIIAIVSAIGQVERLRHELQPHAFAEFDVLCQPQIELEEWISAERIGVLIGPDGVTKNRLQRETGTRIAVDSSTGEVTIDETAAVDPVLALKARDIECCIDSRPGAVESRMRAPSGK